MSFHSAPRVIYQNASINDNLYLQRSNISSAVVNLVLYECEKPGTSSSPWESDVEPLSGNICLDPVPLKWSSKWTLKMVIKDEEESERNNNQMLATS